MKDLSTLMKLFGTKVNNNSPVILTTMGAAGLVATSVLAARAGMVAIWKLTDNDYEYKQMPARQRLWEQTKDTWTLYIPAVTVGLSSLACIIGAHNVHTRRQAAIMSLYSVTDKAFKEYQAKVKEQIGETKEQVVRDEITKDRMAKDPASSSEVIITGKGDHLCYDTYSGRYFKSDIESIRRAENTLNAEVINNNYASQNDFYREIGLSPTAFGDEVGWRTDQMMNLTFASHLSDEGEPCLAINYRAEPIHGYYKSF